MPPSARLAVYIASVSPATAGLSDEAIFPVTACQIAPCCSPERENRVGECTNKGGVYNSALLAPPKNEPIPP